MAKVLIIDAAPMFRDFIQDKLRAEKIEVETATSREAFTRLVKILPELVILNIERFSDSHPIDPAIIEFMEKKSQDPNAGKTPVIVTGPEIDSKEIARLIPFGMVKYFKRPVKFDVFFDSLGKYLPGIFTVDPTPCVLDVHLNNSIIFIEVAMGLNREKITLLKYKLADIIEKNSVAYPKVILMMTSLNLSFVDGMNLELLFNSILSNKKIIRPNMKILSLDSIVADLVQGHEEYAGIEVVKSLSKVLDSLVDREKGDNMADLISDNILSAKEVDEDSTVEMRFSTDTDNAEEIKKDEGSTIRVAVVDDDQIIRLLVQKAFSSIGASTDLYDSGTNFVKTVIDEQSKSYDVIILDIFMEGVNGLEVLLKLREKKVATPVIVYSQAFKKEMIVKSLSLGAKSYLLKPQNPDALVKKAMEVLNAGGTK